MKQFFLYSFFIISFGLNAQTSIELYAPAYKGKYALLNTSEDLVSYANTKIDKQKIDSTGKCVLSINTSESIKTYIYIGSTSAILYIDPSTSKYKVFFPRKEKNSKMIKQSSVELLFDSLPKNDLNTLILELNFRIDDFLFGDSLKISRTLKQDDAFKDSLNQFKKVLLKEYGPIKKKYFHQYIKYSIAGIEQLYLGRGTAINKIYLFENYINQKPILYHNDAYIDFFKLNFDGFFQTNIRLYDKIEHAINNLASATELDEALVNSPFLKDDTIRELVTIDNLYSAFYKNTFNQQNILNILNQLNKQTKIAEHKIILSNILLQINSIKQGSKAPDLNLITFNQDTIHLNNFKGKHIYIQFFTTWNQTALQELKIMEDLYKKYNKYIEFISISLDEQEDDFIRFKQQNRNYKWHFAHYKGENDLLKNYNISSIPTYVLIDEKGLIEEEQAMSPAPNYPRPSIDKTFFYIKKKKEPKNSRVTGGKSN